MGSGISQGSRVIAYTDTGGMSNGAPHPNVTSASLRTPTLAPNPNTTSATAPVVIMEYGDGKKKKSKKKRLGTTPHLAQAPPSAMVGYPQQQYPAPGSVEASQSYPPPPPPHQTGPYGMQPMTTQVAGSNVNYPAQTLPYPASAQQSAMPVPSHVHVTPMYPPQSPDVTFQQMDNSHYLIATPVSASTNENLWSSDSGSDVDMSETSEERDRIYMIVLSADEFLQRMRETDGRILLLSQACEIDLHRQTIRELLGLRAHLQDELLRIERILAELDSKLKCLRPFLKSFPHVVQSLVDLNKKNKLIEAKEAQVDLPTPAMSIAIGSDSPSSMATGSTAVQTTDWTVSPEGIGTMVPGQDSSEFQQTGAAETFETGTTTLTEQELQRHHRQEEQVMAEKYTEKIVAKPGVSQDEVNKLIGDHALGMQALRKRQEEERGKLKEKMKLKAEKRLNAKMQRNKENARLQSETDTRLSKSPLPSIIESSQNSTHDAMTSERPKSSSDDETTGTQTDDNQSIATSYDDDFEESSEEEEEVTNNTTDAMWTKMRLEHRATAHDLHSMLTTIKEDERLKSVLRRQDSKPRLLPEQPTATQSSAHTMAESGDQTRDQQSLFDAQEERDGEYIAKLLRKREHGLPGDEFARLMQSHLANAENVRQFREKQQKLLDAKLQSRLKQRRDGSGSEESDEDSKPVDLNKKLTKLEETFKKDLLKRGDVSESELADMIASYRKRQQRIIQQKDSERGRLDEKLRARLEAKRQKKKKLEPSAIETDEEFWFRIKEKQARGDLTKEEFTQLLNKYMQKEKKKNKKLSRRDTVEQQQRAVDLVEQYQRDQRHAQGLLQAEKDKNDQRLRRRLEAKRNKRPPVQQDSEIHES